MPEREKQSDLMKLTGAPKTFCAFARKQGKSNSQIQREARIQAQRWGDLAAKSPSKREVVLGRRQAKAWVQVQRLAARAG